MKKTSKRSRKEVDRMANKIDAYTQKCVDTIDVKALVKAIAGIIAKAHRTGALDMLEILSS